MSWRSNADGSAERKISSQSPRACAPKKADLNGHTPKANTRIKPQHFCYSSDRSRMTLQLKTYQANVVIGAHAGVRPHNNTGEPYGKAKGNPIITLGLPPFFSCWS